MRKELSQLGEFFRRYRELKLFTVEEVASELDIKDSALIERYESGQEKIPLDHIFALANLLDIPATDLLQEFHSLAYSAYKDDNMLGTKIGGKL